MGKLSGTKGFKPGSATPLEAAVLRLPNTYNKGVD
jgi:hypothetical protein